MVSHRVYLSIASNIEPEANLRRAVVALQPHAKLLALSRCFVTDAIPAPGQLPTKSLPYYINCVAFVETRLAAIPFKFEVLRAIETQLGRVRSTNKYAPRPIDLDILLFDDDIITGDRLTVPDPDITKRWFLAQGILDIAPDLSLPGMAEPLEQRLSQLMEALAKTGETFRVDQALREALLAIA